MIKHAAVCFDIILDHLVHWHIVLFFALYALNICFVLFAMLAGLAALVSRFITLVQTELSQQLSDGL